jgi:putative phosphoribosyl transferase
MFTDRQHAGRRLARALEHYAGRDAVVVALPRGGVPLGAEVAHHLRLPLDIRMPHKIGAPLNPELAIAAVTEDGVLLYDPLVLDEFGLTEEQLEALKDEEMTRIRSRMAALRGHVARRNLEGKTVLLVDDGIATGSTMFAAIQMVRAEGASRVVVAVPVGPPSTIQRLRSDADEVVCLDTPIYFLGIGQFYRNFEQVDDGEVMALLDEAALARS